jgi:hypothetical protein
MATFQFPISIGKESQIYNVMMGATDKEISQCSSTDASSTEHNAPSLMCRKSNIHHYTILLVV